ncbi:MAG: hypothetical protein ACTSYD_12530 [Candidatus Heimdallarchaeaceae archaeon]
MDTTDTNTENSSSMAISQNAASKDIAVKDKDQKHVNFFVRLSFVFIAGFLTFVSTIAKFLLILYDIFVPFELRELAPLLQMYRKYILTAVELLSGHKSQEIVETTNKLEEIKLKEKHAMKAYPLRRGVGEGINIMVSTLVIVVIPVAIWGERLDEKLNLHPIIIAVFFGTALLIVAWIAAIMGPIYALFHKCSMIMVERGAYRLASFYQDLENLFALPYYAAKSSFSFFDAPPINTETYESFKLEIMDELNELKENIQGLLALDVDQVPQRSKEILENLLNELDSSLEELDISKITEKTARAFALLIWSREASLLPWRKDEAIEEFARRNEMSEKEAKRVIQLAVKKIREGYLSDHLFISLLITGALKGITELEKKYEQFLSDIEFNKLALSLALGSKQYLLDHYKEEPILKLVITKISNFFYALVLPLLVLSQAFVQYFKHIFVETGKAFYSLRKRPVRRFVANRYREIISVLTATYHSVREAGRKINYKEDLGLDILKTIWTLLKGLLKIVLALPLGIFAIFKGIYKLIRKMSQPEKKIKNKRKFEKELATATLVSMYEEIYNKVVLSDLSIS